METEKKKYPPVDLRQLEGEVARKMFHEYDGDTLMRDLKAIDGSLQMHEQDVERGMRNENPEKFRWRVSPVVAARLRKEREAVEGKLQKLLDRCAQDAKKYVADLYPDFAEPEPEPQPAPETEPTLKVTTRPKERQAAPPAPIPDAA
jgi:hypothetical protein